MRLVFANIELINVRDEFHADADIISKEEVRKITCRMNVDSGAYRMAINETVQHSLGLKSLRQQSVILANGDVTEDVVGPIKVNFENRTCTVDTYIVSGDNEML